MVALLSEHSVAGLLVVEVKGLGPVVGDVLAAHVEFAGQRGQQM